MTAVHAAELLGAVSGLVAVLGHVAIGIIRAIKEPPKKPQP